MTDKTVNFILDSILPFWQKKINKIIKSHIYDKSSNRAMATALRELRDYSLGINTTMSHNTINFLKEAIIPMETRKMFLNVDAYQNNKNCDCLKEFVRMVGEAYDNKRETKIGLSRHYNMWGYEIRVTPNNKNLECI